MTLQIPFDNSYARLPDRFFVPTRPTPVTAPRLIRVNRNLALQLGLDSDWLASPEGVDVLGGKHVPANGTPIATAYAGHQFGNFVPQLGDGRAVLLGEVIDREGVRRDLQLKGSGPTPFSRGGDGRAAIGPVLREYVVSESMAALGIPTTRSLAAVLTGETVMRETVLPGAVLTRVASSHIRVGTFQFLAARGDVDGLARLADYVISRHYPQAAKADLPYSALLDAVIAAQADLVARWMLVGFIHGVMNTDNVSIAGETIDYGPCAFMDTYDPAKVFSSIDQMGRYAYGNQGRIAQWNVTRLAEALLPILADDEKDAVARAEQSLSQFASLFDKTLHAGFRGKLGLATEQDGDIPLAFDLLKLMADNAADFTLTFRRLSDAADDPQDGSAVGALFANPEAFGAWAVRWRQRLTQDPQDSTSRRDAMRAVNPAFIPRNHRVEAMITAAVVHEDYKPFDTLLAVLSDPYADQPDFADYADPPLAHERVMQTFCGT